jgi:hypothetical protein
MNKPACNLGNFGALCHFEGFFVVKISKMKAEVTIY